MMTMVGDDDDEDGKGGGDDEQHHVRMKSEACLPSLTFYFRQRILTSTINFVTYCFVNMFFKTGKRPE